MRYFHLWKKSFEKAMQTFAYWWQPHVVSDKIDYKKKLLIWENHKNHLLFYLEQEVSILVCFRSYFFKILMEAFPRGVSMIPR